MSLRGECLFPQAARPLSSSERVAPIRMRIHRVIFRIEMPHVYIMKNQELYFV
jgi:hypothetical protein